MFDLNRKIIFIHPPKTGGTTIEAAFGWHPNYNQEAGDQYIKYFLTFKHASLEKHIQGLKIRNLDYEDFFIFACIRNPWDITVSRFFHDRMVASYKYEQLPIYLQNFDLYVKNHVSFLYGQAWFDIAYFTYNNKYGLDYVIRYENYEEDSIKIFNKYGVWWPDKNYNIKSRPKDTPYQKFFSNPNTKSMIEEAAKDYINMFGYKF